jgi:hypothetical protein
MPRPEDRERVEPVRMLRLDRVLPVIELPVIALPVVTLGLPPEVAGREPLAAAGRDAGAFPHVEQ